MSPEATAPKIKKRDRIGVILYLLYVVLLFKAEEFTGQVISSEEGKMEWITPEQLGSIRTVDDFDALLRVMNDPELTEFQYLVDGDRWDAVIR